MFVRVNWAQSDSEGNTVYHMYQCKGYTVTALGFSGDSNGDNRLSRARVVLEDPEHELFLGHGDTAYIMNDEGRTIDIVRT